MRVVFYIICRQRRSTILERTAENPVHKITESEIFLRNIREIYPTLPKKIQSSIDKFAARIEFENQEILKIKNMYNEKPINNTIEENATLSNAWKTIGDLNLKTATDFKLSDDVVISLEDKFKQYVSVRKEVGTYISSDDNYSKYLSTYLYLFKYVKNDVV